MGFRANINILFIEGFKSVKFFIFLWAGFNRVVSPWFKPTVFHTHSLLVGGLANRALYDYQLEAGGRLVFENFLNSF